MGITLYGFSGRNISRSAPLFLPLTPQDHTFWKLLSYRLGPNVSYLARPVPSFSFSPTPSYKSIVHPSARWNCSSPPLLPLVRTETLPTIGRATRPLRPVVSSFTWSTLKNEHLQVNPLCRHFLLFPPPPCEAP